MARVVLGIGMSHSPLLALPGERWVERGNDDRANKGLNTIDGRFVDYNTVNATVKDRYADVAVTETFVRQDKEAQDALDRLADDFRLEDHLSFPFHLAVRPVTPSVARGLFVLVQCWSSGNEIPRRLRPPRDDRVEGRPRFDGLLDSQ